MKKPPITKEKLSSTNEISELWRGQSMDLLKQLHIITREGKINADSRRKLKQVYHLIQFIEPLIQQLYDKTPDPHIVDMGAGKSYLGFILYDLILRNFSSGQLTSIESRPELVAQSIALATASGFERMNFVSSQIETADLAGQKKVNMVCALHACDTATDDALLFGLKHSTDFFVLVPCCQAEIAKQLETLPQAQTQELDGLWRFPLHRREFGSHLTNVIRALYLESLGYKVTVTELIGWEHSLKNELIIAERPPAHKELKPNLRSQAQLEWLLKTTGVKPKLIRFMI